MKTSTAKVSQTIFVGKEAYLYLDKIQREQRGCKPLPKDRQEILWARVKDEKNLRLVDDNSFGGGDGTYHGKWWTWKVETIKAMLDEANLPYIEGKPIEYFEVYL